MNWETEINIYTLSILCIEWITNECLLSSEVCRDLNGEEGQKRRDVCVTYADVFCYIVETNTTLESYYIPIKN